MYLRLAFKDAFKTMSVRKLHSGQTFSMTSSSAQWPAKGSSPSQGIPSHCTPPDRQHAEPEPGKTPKSTGAPAGCPLGPERKSPGGEQQSLKPESRVQRQKEN